MLITKYQLLSKLFYKNRDHYTHAYQTRMSDENTTYLLPVSIYQNPAFLVSSKEVLALTANIYHRNNKLTRLYSKVPKGAVQAYINNSLIEEIISSNNIEGVRSTKKEIKDVMEQLYPKKNKRFASLVKKYRLLQQNEVIPLHSSSDIRALYDDMLFTEIEKSDLPDGEIFRKKSVSVSDLSGKNLHQGILPEQELISYMDQSLSWLHTGDAPELIKIAVFHYLFGYMHPFYDGNGRMARFITSYLLKNFLNHLVSFKLSYIINNNKKNYYMAFEYVNDQKNMGDLTPFVILFLTIIQDAIEALITSLSDMLTKLDHYGAILLAHCADLGDKHERDILFVLMQSTLFAQEGIAISEIAQHAEISENWTRKFVKNLLEANYILKTKEGHKYLYMANLELFDSLQIKNPST